MKKILFCLSLALASFTACTDPNDGEMFVQKTALESEMTATDILEEDPDQFSLWLQLLKHADYYNALKNPDSRATVFCPTNEAINKFLHARGYNSVEDIPVDYAKAVVQVHIIEGTPLLSDSELDNYASADSTASTSIPTVTLFGSQLSVRYGYTITDVDDVYRADSVVYTTDSIFINNQARLDKFTAISCSNANLFTMGDVIVPLTETIMDKLEQDEEFSIFAQAVRDCGYDSIASYTTDASSTSQQNAVVRRYTCFAVPNDVYQRAGITDVASLRTYLANHGEGTDTELINYVKYHFMTREYYTSEVFNFQSDDQTLIYDTQLSGQAIIANMIDGKRYINKTISILRSDIPVRNGLLQKIDDVMPVYHPEPVTVIWDFLNNAEIISFVNTYGAANGLANLFFSAMDNRERQIDLSTEYADGNHGEITTMSYKANETRSRTSNYRRVGYTKETYADRNHQTTPKHGAYMNNYLTLNLGFAGWVEFTSPSIIAGNYKVVLHYIKDVTQMDLFNSGTMTQFDLDDNQSIVYLYKGQPRMPLYDSIETTLWNRISFEDSGLHTFRVTMRDINAKNSSTYHQRLDYLEFIPID